jgi:3,4-dihydroxy-2-butanone 4-phosphate synthase
MKHDPCLINNFVAQGKFVLVADDEDRENEGDLIIAAEKTRTEDMAFLVRYSR